MEFPDGFEWWNVDRAADILLQPAGLDARRAAGGCARVGAREFPGCHACSSLQGLDAGNFNNKGKRRRKNMSGGAHAEFA
jgi:hypothetical protein